MISCLLSCYLTETTIGIIIGSCFTLAGVIANGVITYFLNRNTHSLEVEERKRCEQKKEDDDIKKKREQVYLKFINHYSFLISLGSFRIASGMDIVQWNNMLESVYKDDIKAMFRSVSMTMTDVSLYGTNEMSIKCNKFMEFWNEKFMSSEVCTLEGYKELDRMLSALLGEMKKELGMG
jgi:hypothetical protein